MTDRTAGLKLGIRDPVGSYGFIHHPTDDGRIVQTLNILDEFNRAYLESSSDGSKMFTLVWSYHYPLRHQV